MKLSRKLLIMGSTAALLTAVVPSSVAGGGDNPCYKFSDAERQFKNKINNVRSGLLLGKLHLDPELSKSAKVHTKEMVASDTLYHTSNAQFARRVTNWNMLGENVGVGSSVSSLHSAFMNSPLHRANIVLPTFRHVGVDVIKKDGRMWVTVQFESTRNPGTTLNMPNC
ncbi:MAG: CAP domain-containing protein [Actinomycetota bacterium]